MISAGKSPNGLGCVAPESSRDLEIYKASEPVVTTSIGNPRFDYE
jgi:hypothetical protein